MNFRLVRGTGTDVSYFEDVHPLPGEKARFEFDSKCQAERDDYGHIASFPSPGGGEFVLLIDGTDMQSRVGFLRLSGERCLSRRVRSLSCQPQNDAEQRPDRSNFQR